MKKYISFFLLLILISVIKSVAQEPQKDVNLDALMQLSIEELLDLNVNVQVVSTDGNDIFSSPSTISVINKTTIQDYNFQTISEAIQYVSGISVYRTYLKKNIPTARGILSDHYANKILILINGIPTFNAITGEGILDRISIQSVERIEILKGPASVLYGTNAFCGAINIVLKSEGNTIAESYAGSGYNEYLSSGMLANISVKNMKFFISGNSYSNHPSLYKFTDENNETGYIDDLSRNRNFTLIGTNKNHSLLINGYGNQEGFFGVTPEFRAGAGNHQILKGSLVNYTFKTSLGEKLNIIFKASYDWNNRIISRTRGDSIKSNINGNRFFSSLSAIYKFNNVYNLELGTFADYRHSLEYSNFIHQNLDIISNNNLRNKHILEQSYYAQMNVDAGKILATAGLRYTLNELFGGNFSPRLSLVYQIDKNNAIKAILGESFRAPSLFELYFLNPDSTIFGNTKLKPEKIYSAELAYLKQIDFFFFQLLAYHSIQHNKIQRTTDDIIFNSHLYPGKNIYKNVGKFAAYGLETEIRYNNPDHLQGFINYSLCLGNKDDTVVNSSNYNFKYVPVHQYSVGIDKQLIKKLSAAATLRGWSSVEGPIKRIPSEFVADLTISYSTSFRNIQINNSISVKNVFNNTIEIPEYVRGNINSLPLSYGINVFYTLKLAIF